MTMLRTALRSLFAHKARLTLTAVSIVLGVAFISGTYIYTDTTSKAFSEVFDTAFEGVDIYVSGDSEFTFGQGTFFDESVAADIAGINGVAKVQPGLQVQGVQVIGPDGAPIGGGGPPQLAADMPATGDEVASAFALREGRPPVGPDEVALDVTTAETGGYTLGDEVPISSSTAPERSYTLVGLVGFGEADSLAGATFALFDLPTVQALAGRPGQLTEAYVEVVPDTPVDPVIAEIQAILPDNAKAESAQSASEEQAGDIQESLGFFTNFLLVFAFVALFVGSFIIYNTFRIVVTQRMRELALMRAIGSTRGQVIRTVLLEAVIVGLFSSAIGIIVGLGLAVGMRAILNAFGIDLPSSSLVIESRTIIVALVVGVVVTSASAVFPAIAASRIPPVAAMRADEVVAKRSSLRLRAIIGTVVLVAGAALIWLGLTSDSDSASFVLTLVGLGAAVMILGAYVLSALLARPVAAVIGAPFARWFGVAGKLSQRNAGRSPRRTSATAAAIMVGIALITLASIMSASIQQTVDEIFSNSVQADVVVTAADQLSLGGFSPDLADRAADLPEVADLTRVEAGAVLLNGEETFVGGLDPNFADFFVLDKVEGATDLKAGDLLVDTATATTNGWSIGDAVDLEFEATGVQSFTVATIVTSDTLTGLFLSRDDYAANFTLVTDNQVYVQLADGVTPEQGRDAVAAVAADIPSAVVRTADEQIAGIQDQIEQAVGLITGLLGMTVLVGLIGVTNTMALAVFERTREIGLLRAVGLNQPQTRRMIRYEASIVAAFGALLGVVLGIFFGWAIIQALADQGFESFVIPWLTLAGWVAATTVLGVIFAIWPARRAAKLNVLAAISYE